MSETVKIAYNNCFGGFSLSEEAIELYKKLSGNESYDDYRPNDRKDPILIQVIETLGSKANGSCAELAIATINKGDKYRIDEYDGNESVMTVDDYHWEIA